MDTNDYENLDAIMRILYRGGSQAWYNVYTQANLPKAEADRLYQSLKASGRVTVDHKGYGHNTLDSHYVKLTSVGRVWFDHSNYVDTYVRPKAESTGQIINVINSSVSNLNAQSGTGNHNSSSNQVSNNEPKKNNTSSWMRQYVKEIIIGLVIAIIGGLILKFVFNIG
ncbi:hypothetical protein [Sphingobacterium sp.]|uniref:hypothetical protein n=1 Tax=Sphingobacterium sp. TaxID=341027 RepID=UPI002898A3DB|nr:hypothetical protein [Sphingobacterium sp.]